MRDLEAETNFKRLTNLEITRKRRMWSACRFPQHFEQLEELLFHLFNATGTDDIRQKKIQQLSHHNLRFEVDNAIDKLERYKSSGIGQIQAEMIQSGGKIASSEAPKNWLILFGIKKNFFDISRILLFYPFIGTHKSDLVNNNRGTSQLWIHKKFSNILLSRLMSFADKIFGGSSLVILT